MTKYLSPSCLILILLLFSVSNVKGYSGDPPHYVQKYGQQTYKATKIIVFLQSRNSTFQQTIPSSIHAFPVRINNATSKHIRLFPADSNVFTTLLRKKLLSVFSTLSASHDTITIEFLKHKKALSSNSFLITYDIGFNLSESNSATKQPIILGAITLNLHYIPEDCVNVYLSCLVDIFSSSAQPFVAGTAKIEPSIIIPDYIENAPAVFEFGSISKSMDSGFQYVAQDVEKVLSKLLFYRKRKSIKREK